MRVTELMTPEMAAELLTTYEYNTDIVRGKVDHFKDKMLSGEWKTDNGFFINIRQGKLINGKHRLTAVVESGLTIEMRVQYDR